MNHLEAEMAEAIRAFSIEEEARALREVELPDDFANRIIAQIEFGESGGKTAERNFIVEFLQIKWAAPITMAAAVIMVLVLIPFMISRPIGLAMSLPPLKGGMPT